MTKKKDRQYTTDERNIIKLNKEAKIVRRTIFAIITIFVIVVAFIGFKGYQYVSTALEPMDEDETKEIAVEIPIGTSTDQIGEILEENELIRDKRIFKYYLKFKNSAEFQAGTYELSQSMDLQSIIDTLQTGKVIAEAEHRVTIPEGKDIEQIADIMAGKLDIDAEAFLEKMNDETFLKERIEAYSTILSEDILNEDTIYPLEGYLFAGTYEFFEEEPTIDSIIDQMIEATQAVYQEHVDLIDDSDLSFHEILTMASIVEKESKFSEDRPKVAQVFYNRIAEDMRLQSDITALYALREHKTVVSYDDIDVDSPYNTYKGSGLPPGPIGSPSTESILGVLQPEGKEFDFIYFYARPNGETFYTNSLDEHNEVVSKYRQEWYDLQSDDSNEDDSNENE